MEALDPTSLALWIGALAAASVVAGFAAGLLGVGGGIVIVPVLYQLFTFMGLPPSLAMQMSVGTSLLTIIPTGFMSARSHSKRGAVDWKLIRSWGPLALAGVLCAVIVARYVDGKVLSGVFAVIALIVALDMFLRRNGGQVTDGFPNGFVKHIIGFFIGGFSTLMGIGGGTLSVPILTAVGYQIRNAVGTAAALGPIIAVPGAIGFVINGLDVAGRPPFSIGYVNLAAFALLLPAGLLLPSVGAKVAHKIPQRSLKLLFAAFLFVTAVRMGWGIVFGK
jgi:uncharacterized membrane protein YfcA